MNKIKNICGVVVLYNPDIDVIDNIKTYAGQIDKLYIVDNSDSPIDNKIIKEIASIKNSEYIANNKNTGIAAALNIGAKKGSEKNFKYILTMDQDSRTPADMVSKMLDHVYKKGYKDAEIGIVAPYANDKGNNLIPEEDVEERSKVISSGNLLNLEAYRSAGDFQEDLFIDHVDHEYCMRLREKKYKILRTNRVLMDHNLGNITHHSLFGRAQTTTNHSPLRRYYMTRNACYVSEKFKSKFPDYSKEQVNSFFYETVKIILFEKLKLKKLKAIILGYYDYKKGRMGNYADHHKNRL